MSRTNLMHALKAELEFFTQEGYGHPSRDTWRSTLLFRDSPTCLNFDPRAPLHPCTGCVLMQLVPDSAYHERRPCHHIPITVAGQTIASLYRTGTQQQLDSSFRNWLTETIHKMEQEEPS